MANARDIVGAVHEKRRPSHKAHRHRGARSTTSAPSWPRGHCFDAAFGGHPIRLVGVGSSRHGCAALRFEQSFNTVQNISISRGLHGNRRARVVHARLVSAARPMAAHRSKSARRGGQELWNACSPVRASCSRSPGSKCVRSTRFLRAPLMPGSSRQPGAVASRRARVGSNSNSNSALRCKAGAWRRPSCGASCRGGSHATK